MDMISVLKSVLEAFGLSEYVEPIAAAGKDSILIALDIAQEKDIPLGSSKMGGLPDLPDGVDWFRHKRTGLPLSFVCQINFAETAPYDRAHKLPDHGILYFFYDTSEEMPWGFDPEDGDGKVLYYYEGDLSDLKQLQPPEELEACGSVFAAANMRFSWVMDFPDLESAAGEALPLREEDKEKYYQIEDRFSGVTNKLLGHSNNLQGDMELECELVSHGLSCGDPAGYAEGYARGLDRNKRRWSLLLQVESNDELDMMWGDVGRLYVWIPDEALEARDFQAGWVILQCG